MAALPNFITLEDAAGRLKRKVDELRQMAEKGSINAIMMNGTLAISETDVYKLQPTPRDELAEYQPFKHLKGSGISQNEAARKYGISQTTLLGWRKKGYIGEIGFDSNKILLDEADVAYSAWVYNKAGGGRGGRIFRDDGTPWSQRPRIRKKTINEGHQISREELARRRDEGMRLLRAGESQAQVARLVRVSEASISRWKHQVDLEKEKSLAV